MRGVINRKAVKVQVTDALVRSSAPPCIKIVSIGLIDECDRAAAAAIEAVVRVAVAQHRRGTATLKPPVIGSHAALRPIYGDRS